MLLAEAVITRAGAAAGVTAIVGSRLYWSKRDQGGGMPAAVFQQVGGFLPTEHLTGDGDLIESRVQAKCFAKTYAQARRLALAIGAAFADEADVDGFLFWNADVDRPLDFGGEDSPAGYEHLVIVDLVLRHSAES